MINLRSGVAIADSLCLACRRNFVRACRTVEGLKDDFVRCVAYRDTRGTMGDRTRAGSQWKRAKQRRMHTHSGERHEIELDQAT